MDVFVLFIFNCCTLVGVWMRWPVSRLPSLYLPLLPRPPVSLCLLAILSQLLSISVALVKCNCTVCDTIAYIVRRWLLWIHYNYLYSRCFTVAVVVGAVTVFVSIRSTCLSSLIFSEPCTCMGECMWRLSPFFQWAATNNFQAARMHTINYLTLPHCCCQV